MRLHLIRHAQSTANVLRLLDTAMPGPPLTDLGREQAEALAKNLAEEPIVSVYSSVATRAQQTAAPLAATFDTDVRVVDGVQEVFVGDLEGRSDQEAVERYLATVLPWIKGDLSGSMPGGESGEQVRARFLGAVAEIRAKHEQTDPDGTVALVSHGGAIRLGAEWLSDNVRPEIADRMLPNTGIVTLETRGDRWHCVSWAGIPL